MASTRTDNPINGEIAPRFSQTDSATLNARNDLQQAVNELNQAEHDKGGHRENAVGLAQQAINQVNQGIVAGGGTP
jgi:uncharacterized protein YoxC